MKVCFLWSKQGLFGFVARQLFSGLRQGDSYPEKSLKLTKNSPQTSLWQTSEKSLSFKLAIKRSLGTCRSFRCQRNCQQTDIKYKSKISRMIIYCNRVKNRVWHDRTRSKESSWRFTKSSKLTFDSVCTT